MVLQRIAIEERAAQTRQQIGQITQAQLFELEREFEQQRFALARDALQAKAESDQATVEQHQQYLLQLEELELAHQGRLAEITNQATEFAARKQEAQARSLEAVFSNSIKGLINKTMTMQQAIGQVVQQIAQQFIRQEALKLARVVTSQTSMTGATVAGNAIRSSSDMSAARLSTAATSQTAVKSITSKAASVFASVYDAIAGIPYVGPFLAPVMAIAATGAVMGYVSNVASAEGSYDIPAGVTQ